MNPCWVLSAPRSGTTYFTDLLNNTGLFSSRFDEHFNHVLYNTKDFASNPNKYRYCKLMPEHWDYAKLNPKLIREVLPGIKIVRLHRQSIVDKALSLYFAVQSHIWCVSEGDQLNEIKSKSKLADMITKSKSEYLSVEIKETREALNKALCQAMQNEERCDEIARAMNVEFVITYEELIESPKQTLSKFFAYLLPDVIQNAVQTCPLSPMPERAEAKRIKQILTGMSKIIL